LKPRRGTKKVSRKDAAGTPAKLAKKNNEKVIATFAALSILINS